VVITKKNMTGLITIGILGIIMMMVPKIIKGAKEAIRFAGRVLGWGIGIVILYILITTLI
jgi:hypothetical protein